MRTKVRNRALLISPDFPTRPCHVRLALRLKLAMKSMPTAKEASSLRFFGTLSTGSEALQERMQILDLFRQRAEASVRLAYHLTRDRDAALDLSQEAFVKALETISSLQDPALLTPWFNRIVVNLCRDWQRRRFSSHKAQAVIKQRFERVEPDPAVHAEINEEAERTRAALMGLPQEYREALVLVCVEELSPRDAAYALNVPDGTLRWRLHEGRRLMREALDQPNPKEGDA